MASRRESQMESSRELVLSRRRNMRTNSLRKRVMSFTKRKKTKKKKRSLWSYSADCSFFQPLCVCVCVHPVINLNTFKVVKREGQVKRGFYLMRRESVRDYVCVCKSSVG